MIESMNKKILKTTLFLIFIFCHSLWAAESALKFPLTVRVTGEAHFFDLPKNCPPKGDCPWYKKSYLIRDDQVIVDQQVDYFSHVTFTNSKGKKTVGWLSTSDLNIPEAPTTDPSQDIELLSADKCGEKPSPGDVHYRFRVDLNSDGLEDVLISGPACDFGNAEGNYVVYLKQKSGLFQNIGAIFAHPLALSFRMNKNSEGVITTYSHASASDGMLTQFLISKGELRELPGHMVLSENSTKELTKDGAKILSSETGTITKDKVIWKAD